MIYWAKCEPLFFLNIIANKKQISIHAWFIVLIFVKFLNTRRKLTINTKRRNVPTTRNYYIFQQISFRYE